MRRFIACCVLSIFLLAGQALGQTFDLASPDGQISAVVKVVDGNVYYDLFHNGAQVVDDSRLGLIVSQNSSADDLGAGITSITAGSITNNDTTFPTIGDHTVGTNDYNDEVFTVTKGGLTNDIEIRAFGNGLAFRYTTPGTSGTQLVLGESSQWQFPSTATGYYQNDPWGDYASTWKNSTMSSIAAMSALAGPFVVQYAAGGGYAAVSESDNIGYSGMTYKGAGSDTIQAAFVKDPSGFTVDSGTDTPWRTIVVGSTLNDLVNSDMINSLAPPANPTLYPQGLSTSWIKPGVAMWSWLDSNDGGKAGANPTTIMNYIDEANKLGFQYFTIDSGWSTNFGTNPFPTLQTLTAYGASKGIGLLVWKNSLDFEVGDSYSIPTMESFLDQCKAAGVVGLKIDWLEGSNPLLGESQQTLDFMAATLQYAAQDQLMIDFHGAPKPAGWQITYPNLMTIEDIRGMEAGANAQQDATLPFTISNAGPSDYTPGVFTPDSAPGLRGNTTWAHQMAMGILIVSPLLHWASGPTEISNAMPDGSDQLKVFTSIPSTWDQTDVLSISKIGTLAAFARRSGDEWFLSMASGSSSTMNLTNVDLSFLGDGEFNAILLGDGATNGSWNVTGLSDISSTFDLNVSMRGGGGFVAMFTPVPEPASLSFILLGAVLLRRRASR